MMINYRDVVRNVMAREKALYEGHAVAAVATTSAVIAKEALNLIKVDYEVLPHVIDVVEAMLPGAPLLHEDMFTAGVEPAPKTASNVAKRLEIGHGDIAAGFRQADLVVERTFTTKPVHQGYIEPHACICQCVGGRPGRRVGVDPGPLGDPRARFASSGIRSILVTRSASSDKSAAWYPDPPPSSNTFSDPVNSAACSIIATIGGYEMV